MIKDKKTILKALEEIQKDTFHINVSQDNLLSLFSNPTSTVHNFYEKVERMFGVTFYEKPMTLDDMADTIIKNLN